MRILGNTNTVEALFYEHPQNQIGVVVKQGWSSTRLDNFTTCGLRHTRIYILTVSTKLRTSFRVHCRTRENAATYPLQRLRAPPTLSPFNTEQRRPALAAFSNNNAVFFLDQSTQHFDIGRYKTTFRKHRSIIGSHMYVACLTAAFVLFPLYPSRPIESASCRPPT